MLLACYSHKHISYRIRTIIRKAITLQYRLFDSLIMRIGITLLFFSLDSCKVLQD
ncbi:hypothetical protein [Wolbachia endosymbiont (group A) of Gymnosoma rotundatum]|uniref:hypothetical protein n=1 Tax=Wolbachia endosymbiont (group A) of Gymnosoma rotundatum TaxID=2954016 RepID=UPI00222663E8|nr:hypothetical protein [Wolbachia endosymbiont (group A) of Gymnosoma rotundatum]